MDIKKALYGTIHRKKESVEEIADRVGCSASLLYRCCNVNDSQARFPLEKLLPLMRSVNDYSILRHLASRSGFILYKLPSRIKHNRAADLNKYQSLFTETFRSLLRFKDGEISKGECLKNIDRLLSSTVGIRKGIEKSDQMDFNFLEG